MMINSSNRPLVSVAMATFNAGPYLALQFDSLLNQTYPNIEIVVSDDCSTDDTYETLLKIATSDSRVKILPQGKRLGFNGNFTRCFNACQGAWISPCDQDDIWELNKIERLLEAAEPDGLAYCDSSFINERGEPISYRGTRLMSEKVNSESNPSLLSLLMRSIAPGHALIFPRELFDTMPELPDGVYFDHWITIWARANGRSLVFLNEPLVHYRRFEKSVTVEIVKPSKAVLKTRTLEQRWSQLATLNQHLPASGEQQLVATFLNIFQHWLEHFISLRAFLFFRKWQDDLFRKEAPRKRRRKIYSYILGYKARSRLRPRHYPAVLRYEDTRIVFDLDKA